MLRRSLFPLVAVLAFAATAACTGGTDETPATPAATDAATPVVSPITPQDLENATITTDLVPEGQVSLQAGAHSQPAAPGSASTVDFEVASTVIDDLDGDGIDDGAMIVRSSGSGSGTFYDLYVFLASEGGPQQVAKEQLGDRILVEGTAAGPGGVTVFYLDRPAAAPMTEAPTVPAAVKVEVTPEGMVRVSREQRSPATVTATATATAVAGGDACADLAPEAADASFVFVGNVRSGDVLTSGAMVQGCSRTFESTLTWSLLDREGNVLAEGFTMGGGVDGPAPYEFAVDYSVAEPQVGHLFVEAPDPSGGEGFPPVTNQIPVVLLP